jgi:alpha-ribazole phosphatase
MRHPAPAIAPGICYGASDIGLAAPPSPEHFADVPRFDRLLASPLSRCRQVAQMLGAMHGLAPLFDRRLQEIDFGAWEMQKWDDIPRAEIDAWAEDFLHARPHGGESVAMLAARVAAALDAHRASQGDTLIITHAGVIRAALADWRAEIPYGAWRVMG